MRYDTIWRKQKKNLAKFHEQFLVWHKILQSEFSVTSTLVSKNEKMLLKNQEYIISFLTSKRTTFLCERNSNRLNPNTHATMWENFGLYELTNWMQMNSRGKMFGQSDTVPLWCKKKSELELEHEAKENQSDWNWKQ